MKGLYLWRILIITTICTCAISVCSGQEALSLDSCRSRALRHNKSLQIADETVRQARYIRQAARGAYLPGIDFTGFYFYNSKDIRLIDVDKLRSAITDLGVPSSVSSWLIPNDFLELDTHNVGMGAVTVTQPLFLGGKILAMNRIADNAERLSQSQRQLAEKEVIAAVDEAYWLTISLLHKKELAESFVALIDSLYHNVNIMISEGIATQSDGLTVEVALNEAEISLTKVENGLSLSRMLLAQLCGMPIDTIFRLSDEELSEVPSLPPLSYDINRVYDRRNEIRSLGYLTQIAKEQQNIALSDMLPSALLVGAYTFSTPNLYNGFQNCVDGMFRIGILLRVPIFHWGVNFYKYKASRSATVISRIETEIAKEQINLQVKQAAYKASEAVKTYEMTCRNMTNAERNLYNAQIAFSEGIYTVSDVLAAQTAWQQARSEKIDASINVCICSNNFNRAIGIPVY